jgi:tryptophanyl-tRNA synthetase
MDKIQDLSPTYKSQDNGDFGSDEISENIINKFPTPIHRLIKRRIFNRHRDIESFLTAVNSDRQHSIVTGIGPSGSMHIGHIIPLYFAKYMQEKTGARVYIPISDDEKFLTSDASIQSIQDYTLRNIRNILAIGFDPSKTRIIIDLNDSSMIYPLATRFASEMTVSQVDSVYENVDNVGEYFYPAVQVSHLLLPQLVYGEHNSIMLSAQDQDPHIRLARDIADKSRYPVLKPGCLLSKPIPSLSNTNSKMSSSESIPTIELNDDPNEVEKKIIENAISGGKKHREKHRSEGGDPNEDLSYNLLYYFFEEEDEQIKQLYKGYKNGEILSSEMKRRAASRISEFLSSHQARKSALGPVSEEIKDYRLTKTERHSALTRVGFSTELLFER